MTHKTQKLVVADPRTFEGDPFEVAGRTVTQTVAIVDVLSGALADANIMARNAEMERKLQAGEDPNAAGWDQHALGRRFQALDSTVAELRDLLISAGRAASYNPKRPPKA